MYDLAARIGYIGMHSHTAPGLVGVYPAYANVYHEVAAHLRCLALAARTKDRGLDQMWIDPGIDYGKNCEDKIALARQLSALCAFGIRGPRRQPEVLE